MGMGSKKNAHMDVVVGDHAKTLLLEKSRSNTMACAMAFNCADTLNQTRQKTGIFLDKLHIRLEKCQLGLFGHGGDQKKGKKFLELTDSESIKIKSIIEGNVKEGILTCPEIWDLAEKSGMGRMKISTYCEKSGIKIKGCQLGAF